ncbi:MAG: hypothetical protein NC218_04520 [Acetobacter sp.]|nr:hypothetical protein [Acetobacter sp.]
MKKISNVFMTAAPINLKTLIKEKENFCNKIKNITIIKTFELSIKEYEKFANNFLDFYEDFQTPTNTENVFYVIEIKCNKYPTIYVSTDGRSYPRYIGISDYLSENK